MSGQRPDWTVNAPLGTCSFTGKQQYSSKRTAKRFARTRSFNTLHPYECEACGYWHLGRMYGRSRDDHRQLQRSRLHNAA